MEALGPISSPVNKCAMCLHVNIPETLALKATIQCRRPTGPRLHGALAKNGVLPMEIADVCLPLQLPSCVILGDSQAYNRPHLCDGRDKIQMVTGFSERVLCRREPGSFRTSTERAAHPGLLLVLGQEG